MTLTTDGTGPADALANLRGAALMVAAMACFAVEDALIKGLSERFSAAQILWMLGLGGASAFAALMAMRGVPILSRTICAHG